MAEPSVYMPVYAIEYTHCVWVSLYTSFNCHGNGISSNSIVCQDEAQAGTDGILNSIKSCFNVFIVLVINA